MAVSSINNSSFSRIPINLNHNVNREQRVNNTNNQISRIDREIAARENLVNSNNRVVNITENLVNATQDIINTNRESIQIGEQLISSNNRLITAQVEQRNCIQESINTRQKLVAGNERLIQLYKESRDCTREQTAIHKNRVERLGALLDKVRGKSSEPKPPAVQLESTAQSKRANSTDKIAQSDTTVADKGKSVNYKLPDLDEKTYKNSVLDTGFIGKTKEDKAVKPTVNESAKHSIAKYTSVGTQTENTPTRVAKKAVTKAEAGTQTDIITVNKKEGLATSYEPTRSNRFSNAENDAVAAQTRAARNEALLRMVQSSQKNLYESIVASRVSKLI